MFLDPVPVFLLTSLVSAVVGALLTFAYVQSRKHPELLVWGCADLVGAVAVGLLLLRNAIPDSVSVVVPMGLLSCAYAAIWAAFRSFGGRRPLPLGMAAGPLVWLFACPAISRSAEARAVVISLIVASYSLAAAYELWRDRRESLLSRCPLVICLVVHAGLVLTRLVALLAIPLTDQVLTHPRAGVMAIEPTILVVVLGFLQLSMAMERSERVQRRAAMTDALTGIASRRAFFEGGGQRLEAAGRAGKPTTLLLFDLDHFKSINDRFGHEIGDDALRAFAAHVGVLLGGGALFGRLGGEEFAALLPGATGDVALSIAEKCRAMVETLAVGMEEVRPTLSVSVGVATAKQPCGLDDLLRQADHALYGAKSAGRNGVRMYRTQPPSLARSPDFVHLHRAQRPFPEADLTRPVRGSILGLEAVG